MRVLNVLKDKPDSRDWTFDKLLAKIHAKNTVQTSAVSDGLKATPARALPPAPSSKVDFRSIMPPIVDQGNLGSCTGNAIASAFQYEQMKQKIGVFAPSRLFIYYNERLIEGTVNVDSGAYIRDGIKVINTYGVCPETVWPYNVSQFKVKPSQAAYDQAKLHTALGYYRVNVALADIKTALNAGFPVVIGFTVYNSFLSAAVAKTGVMSMPSKSDGIAGGHCVLIVGYDDSKSQFICRNSWGTSWGDKGYFYMPYAYATPNLMNDLWVVSSVK